MREEHRCYFYCRRTRSTSVASDNNEPAHGPIVQFGCQLFPHQRPTVCFRATVPSLTPLPYSTARVHVHVHQVFLAVDGWAKAWKCREATRGAATNFAAFGRSPPPAVAEQQSRQTPGGGSTNRSSSSSRSVKKTLSAGDLPPSEKARSRNAQDARRQRGGSGCWSGAADTEHSLLERRNGTNNKGCTGGESTAPPLPVEATAAAAVSGAADAAAAAGGAAVARRAGEAQQAAAKPSASAASAPSAASNGGPNATSRGTNSDDATVAPSSPDPSRSASPTLTFTSGTAAVGAGGVGRGRNVDHLSASVVGTVGEDSRKGTVGETVTVRGVLQRRASGSTGGKEKQGGWAGGMARQPASFSHPAPPPGSSAVIRGPGSSGLVAIDVSVDAGEEAMASMPDEERAFVDELLMEIRLPLISTSFLCQGTDGCNCFSCAVLRSLRCPPTQRIRRTTLLIAFVPGFLRRPLREHCCALLLGLSPRFRPASVRPTLCNITLVRNGVCSVAFFLRVRSGRKVPGNNRQQSSAETAARGLPVPSHDFDGCCRRGRALPGQPPCQGQLVRRWLSREGRPVHLVWFLFSATNPSFYSTHVVVPSSIAREYLSLNPALPLCLGFMWISRSGAPLSFRSAYCCHLMTNYACPQPLLSSSGGTSEFCSEKVTRASGRWKISALLSQRCENEVLLTLPCFSLNATQTKEKRCNVHGFI